MNFFKKNILSLLFIFCLRVVFCEQIELKLPLHNSCFLYSQTDILFLWEGQTTSNWEIDIAIDSNFLNPTNYFSSADSIVISTNSLPNNQVYYWRMRNNTDTSKTRSFTLFSLSEIGELVFHINAQSGITSSGGRISQWNNLADTLHNAFQNVNNDKPELFSNSLYAKDMVRFSGSNGSNWTGMAVIPSFSIIDSNFTIISSYKNNSFRPLGYIFSFPPPTPKGFFVGGSGQVMNNFGLVNHSSQNGVQVVRTISNSEDLNWGIRTAKHDKLFLNGQILPDDNEKVDGVGFNFLGTRTDARDVFNFHGFLTDILIYNEILSDSSRILVENYLKTKYTPYPDLGDDLFVCDTKTKIGFRTDHPYSNITWSTGQTGLDSIEITQNGTYWVEVVSFGWTISDTIEITGILDPPQISYNQDTVLCLGDSLTVNYIPIPDYVPVWSSGDTANSYTIKDFSQNVYLVHYDTNNCFASTDTFFIKIDSLQLFSTLGDDRSLCNGGTLAVSTTSTEGPFEYLWSTTDTTPSINFSSYGLFNISVEMTDFNECVFRDTVQINSININVPTVQFEFDTACPGLPTQFTDLSTPGGTDNVVSWVWTFNTSDSAFINNPSFTFPEGIFPVHLSVLTDSGCTNSTQQLINTYPSPTSDFNTTIACANDTVTLNQLSTINPNDSIISFEWIIQGNSFFGSSIQTTFDSADTYSLQLISTSSNFCKDTLSLPIEIFPEFLIDFDFENTCLGDTIQFINTSTSLSIVDKQWNFDFFGQSSQDDNPVFYYPNTGTYDVEYTCVNAIGCQSSITKTVTIRPNPTASFETDAPCITNATLFFYNDSSSLLNQHKWSINNDTISGDSAIVRFDLADNYLIYYSITDSFGCSDDTSQFVNISEGPIADFSFTPNYGTSPIDIQFVNNSQNANSYFWDFGDGNTSIEINPINNYQNNDTYSITLWASDSLACVDSLSKNLPIIPTDLDIELSNLKLLSNNQADGSIRYTPIVTIKNVGTRLISNFDLALSINQEIPIIESWEGTLPIGASLLYTLSNTLDIYSPSTFDYLCVNAKNVNDNTEVNFSNNKVCVSNKNELQLSNVYPNPATNIAQIEIIANSDGKSNAYIYDKIGQQISSTNLNLSEGYNVLQFDCSNLQSGEYYILFEFQNENYSRKFWVTNQ